MDQVLENLTVKRRGIIYTKMMANKGGFRIPRVASAGGDLPPDITSRRRKQPVEAQRLDGSELHRD